ncbi:hypothetical protein E2H86_00185 [Pseudomonas putida]|uniref:hypothetical protein n=1 Tax=Pseudomonas TaxID=286 RepID=UPI0010593687|nr:MULTISPECIES: hypothetical protein [Pseudomonas]MBF8748275.1 hypothetical protein [Pseudomonas monteilii]MCT8165236.1 hypothetical protein [Pseudomonas sp. HD6422]MCT8184097.1 hypothetical protein [Pseudomonas sp. HD6421]TDJ79065.1 hypothetical protein E2H86_00185 [Pseudomonas putida]
MEHDDRKPADKVPHVVSSEQAQQGERAPKPVLERPDPDTEAVDKVITPTSTQEVEEQTEAIEKRLRDVEGKASR